MKQKFSTKWKASKQPRKQRKYLAKAPLHIRRKFLSVNLSKELRKKYGKRNIPVRKGDTIKIMRGKYKKKQGKVIEVKTKLEKIYVEGIQVKKTDGSKANIPLRTSNLQIVQLNIDDKKRFKNSEIETKHKEANLRTPKSGRSEEKLEIRQKETGKIEEESLRTPKHGRSEAELRSPLRRRSEEKSGDKK
ncbi:MAG: 50S ribosomal protein L24 [Nanoarchaeota archaeon]|nr:50S ribosomal protein L24 [Nanoarchaeota archaeon]